MAEGIFNSIKNLFRKIARTSVTEEEIHSLIDVGEQEGVINRDEHAMIDAVLDLGDTLVREILVPRTEMVAVEITTPIIEVLETIIAAGHSRIPVYEGDIDHITGILYAKDLLKLWGKLPEEISIKSVCRKAYFIPETKTTADLLKEFKVRRVHMAVAVDEYGGTSGIITIEDILEEIVGEIQDEHDPVEQSGISRLDDGSYILDARSHIEDVEDELDVQLPRGEYDTLGGFLSHLMGHVPVQGEQGRYGTLLFTVEEADSRKVSTIRVSVEEEGA
ncbi:MAG: hemolysin family protein [bacterium]|nr:hemolysin family protein [bacterium]MDT8364873.1 hemolysin family protein [bacterium]